MDRYAVVGNPVGHSLSPRIHAAFARATGQSLEYATLLAPLDAFAATVADFFAAGGAGLNVTVPFKEQAAAWVTELTPAAAAAGAVNTIEPVTGGFRGHNTDGVGLVRDLTVNCGEVIMGRRVLLLGAGGAARGVLRPLLAQRPAELVLANRSVARAQMLVATLCGAAAADLPAGTALRAAALDEPDGAFDIVINATAAGLQAGDPVAAVSPAVVRGAFCYDLLYGRPTGDPGESAGAVPATVFCRWAREHGARRVEDGLGMLVEQAAAAFTIWRGVVPDTRSVLDGLRAGEL
jgi:shikimate dehydrogenase